MAVLKWHHHDKYMLHVSTALCEVTDVKRVYQLLSLHLSIEAGVRAPESGDHLQ